MTTTTTRLAKALWLKPLAQAEVAGIKPTPLDGSGPLVIGRARGCDLCLTDPTISRRHATLMQRDRQWFVMDLGGRQGTFLNGVRLEPECATMIAPGDYVRVGPYPFRLEAGAGEGTGSTIAVTESVVPQGTIIERVPEPEIGSVAQRRLDLLIEGAAAIQKAQDEEALAWAVLDAVLEGTGYPRGAYLRSLGAADHVEVIASRDTVGTDGPSFSFSQSLLREASVGHIARMSQQQSAAALGQSIERLGICSALCAPVMLDAAVVAYVYLDARDDERPGDTDSAGFCLAVAKLAGLALANVKRGELEKRQHRLEEDLKGARQAQAFLCPDGHGDIGQLRYAMQTHPGRVVAGDLFDIFPIADGRVAICFGDVSGQGMRAAIHMTAVLSNLRAALARNPEPADAATTVNRYIAERSPEDMFVSLWVGVFEPGSKSLSYVDAGHGHWMLKRRHQTAATPGLPGGLLIGIKPDYEYEATTIELGDGDRVILFSDGVCERAAPSGEQFGTARVSEALEGSETPIDDVERLFASSQTFAGEAPIADDTTVASVELRDA